MDKVKSLFDLNAGDYVKFKTKLFGRERSVLGEFVNFRDSDTGWCITLKNYAIEGVLIDYFDKCSQGFTMSYGADIYRLKK